MSKKDKKNADALVFFILVITILVVVYMFKTFITFITYTNNLTLENKYNFVLDKYADLWCKGQSYKVIIEPEKIESIDIKAKIIPEKCYENFCIVELYERINGSEKLMYNGTLECFRIGETDIFSCQYIIPTKTENRTFETGKFLPQENKIECLAEKSCLISVCNPEKQGICKDEYMLYNEFIKTIPEEYCSNIKYQKSQKFEVE